MFESFNVEDIRRVRDESYEATKNMSIEERIEYTKKSASEFKLLLTREPKEKSPR